MSTLEERLAHELATLTAANEALVVVNQEANEQIVARRAALDAARAGAAVATERFVAAEGRADRYREALERIVPESLRDGTPFICGECGSYIPTFPHRDHCTLGPTIEIVREALADTSPPAQPACTRCGDAREVYFDDAGALARGYMRPCPDCASQPPRPLAGKVARHLEDLEEPAAQPVALPPAREVAHGMVSGIGRCVFGRGVGNVHGVLCNRLTEFIEADRAQRDRSQVGLHQATVEACAKEAERYPMSGQSSLGMQAAIARRIRSLLSQPGGGR